MFKTIHSHIIIADSTLRTNPKRLRLVFQGTFESYFVTPGLSFSFENENDMQELDLLMEVTGVMGDGWQSQLIGKEVDLIVDLTEIDRNDFRIAVKAIGLKRSDETTSYNLFLILNKKHTLVTEETAMQILMEENAKEDN